MWFLPFFFYFLTPFGVWFCHILSSDRISNRLLQLQIIIFWQSRCHCTTENLLLIILLAGYFSNRLLPASLFCFCYCLVTTYYHHMSTQSQWSSKSTTPSKCQVQKAICSPFSGCLITTFYRHTPTQSQPSPLSQSSQAIISCKKPNKQYNEQHQNQFFHTSIKILISCSHIVHKAYSLGLRPLQKPLVGISFISNKQLNHKSNPPNRQHSLTIVY